MHHTIMDPVHQQRKTAIRMYNFIMDRQRHNTALHSDTETYNTVATTLQCQRAKQCG